MSEHDIVFDSMGSEVRLIVDSPERAASARRFLERFEAVLSRFRPDSELCRLNADPGDAPAAGPLLRTAVRAGLWAAERTGGLVDPTLVGALEDAGYAGDRRAPELTAGEALALAPARAPATPDPRARWRQVDVDDGAGVVRRPPGAAARHRRHRQGACRGPAGGTAGRRCRAGPSTVAATCASARRQPRRSRSTCAIP